MFVGRLFQDCRLRVLALFRTVNWQMYGKGASLVGLRSYRDAATMSLSNPFDNCQAKSGAAVHAVSGFIDSIKAIKDMGEMLGMDTDA